MPFSGQVRAAYVAFFFPMTLMTTGCFPGSLLGIGGDSGTGAFTPNYGLSPPAHRTELPCRDPDANNLCIALNYVVYQDGTGQPLISKARAGANVQELNLTWSQCHLQFYLENFVAANPRDYGLDPQPSSTAQLTPVRAAFADGSRLTVVTTGEWTGNLAAQGPNAWTQMPAVGPFGSVLEAPVASVSALIAHELGHYLNLSHANDPYNVMNPIVYGNSINITEDQCAEARATAISFWGGMLR